jgi:hypothetical protein
MALGLTQPLTDMSTRRYFGGVGHGRRLKLTTSPVSVSRVSCVRACVRVCVAFGVEWGPKYLSSVCPQPLFTSAHSKVWTGILNERPSFYDAILTNGM